MEAVDLIGDEAESLVGKTYQKPSGHYLTGMDLFHQLHCLVCHYPIQHPIQLTLTI